MVLKKQNIFCITKIKKNQKAKKRGLNHLNQPKKFKLTFEKKKS